MVAPDARQISVGGYVLWLGGGASPVFINQNFVFTLSDPLLFPIVLSQGALSQVLSFLSLNDKRITFTGTTNQLVVSALHIIKYFVLALICA